MKELKRCENGRISAITLITQHSYLSGLSLGLRSTKSRKAKSIKVEGEDCKECWNPLTHTSSLQEQNSNMPEQLSQES